MINKYIKLLSNQMAHHSIIPAEKSTLYPPAVLLDFPALLSVDLQLSIFLLIPFLAKCSIFSLCA